MYVCLRTLFIALVGIGGTLLGVLLQSIITGVIAHFKRLREQAAKQGLVLVELLDAGAKIKRWASDANPPSAESDTMLLKTYLDKAWNKAHLLCPQEIIDSALPYIRTANMLLKGRANLDTLDWNEQAIPLVYRRVAKIDRSIPFIYKGKSARKHVAEENN